MKRRFRTPPKFGFSNSDELARKLVLPIANDLLRGKSNNTFDVTLAVAPATTTTVTTDLCTEDSIVLCTPQSATAATAVGAGVLWTEPKNGSFVLHHDSSASADRTFGVAILG